MTEYEKGYRDAQVKIIQNMFDIEGDWLLRECDRLEKEVGLPAKEIGTIIWDYKHQLNKKEFDRIVAESNSKEEAVYHLIVANFIRNYIKKNLGVSDAFIDHCLFDDIRFDLARKVYNKLKSKPNRSAEESRFYWNYVEGYIEGLKLGNRSLIEAVSMMYAYGSTTETIKNILEPLKLTKDQLEYLLQKAKSKYDKENSEKQDVKAETYKE